MKQHNSNNEFNNENFQELFEEYSNNIKKFEGQIVKGLVIDIDNYYMTVDVGLKSEGKILLSEFKQADDTIPSFEIGQEVEVYIERYEDLTGSIMLSREKAKREEAWSRLEKLHTDGTPVEGYVVKRIKGGFSVIVDDTVAFLPGSQLGSRPIKNINSLVGTTQQLEILKMDKKRYNIVVSRKSIMDKAALEGELEGQTQYEEGQVVEGVVKNITGYGAFIDLGYVDGLLHITDISWSRINHPSEVLELNQNIKLKVIKINPENKRISLGLKQLAENPWNNVEKTYAVGNVFNSKITNITDYGIFVELDKGIEGLVHISEMSWVRKDINTRSEFQIGDEQEVKVIEIDTKKHRLNLSIKRCLPNPFVQYIEENPEGSIVDVEVTKININSLTVKLNDTIEGFIKSSDLSWDLKDKDLLDQYSVGDQVKAKILRYNSEKDKIALGVKQLEEDSYSQALSGMKKGQVVKGKVTDVSDKGLEVSVENGANGFIKISDLSTDFSERRVENYKVGDTIEAVVTQINHANRSVTLSIKSLELMEQKENMSIGSDVSSSLADIFEEARNKKDKENN